MVLGIIYVGILIANILCTLINNNSKIVALVGVFITWIVAWGCYDNVDYNNYLMYYNGGGTHKEIGYAITANICRTLGISYNEYIAILLLITLTIAILVVMKITRNYTLIVSCYMAIMALVWAIQIRDFVAVVLFCVAVVLAIYSDKLKKTKYLTLLIVSSTFHASSLFFMPAALFLGTHKREYSSVLYIIMAAAIICAVIMLFFGNEVQIFYTIMSIVAGEYRASQYLSSDIEPIKVMVFFALEVINFLLVKISRNIFKSNKLNDNYDAKAHIVDCVYWLNIYAFISVPLYVINLNFFRLFRYLNLLNFLVFAVTAESFAIKNNSFSIKRANYICLIGIGIFPAMLLILYEFNIYSDLFVNNYFNDAIIAFFNI